MKKSVLFLSLITLVGNTVYAQKNKKADEKPKAKEESMYKGFTSLGGGLEYKLIKDAPGDQKPKLGDYVEVHLDTRIGDSSLFNTRTVNNNMPVQFQITQPQFKGDLVEGLMQITAGDSAAFLISVDSLVKAGTPTLPWMKLNSNQKISYYVQLVSVKSSEVMQKEQAEKAAAQKGIDDKLIQDYLAKNNIKATKTESGLYYSISQEGKGNQARPGDTAVVNYTGMTLEGKKFDSNMDPAFMHVQPFEFAVGMGMVIKGWDEGFMLLKKGSKGTLYIPSGLAYGPNSPDPNKIPANGVLLFDVELVSIKSPATAGSQNKPVENETMKKDTKSTKPAKKN